MTVQKILGKKKCCLAMHQVSGIPDTSFMLYLVLFRNMMFILLHLRFCRLVWFGDMITLPRTNVHDGRVVGVSAVVEERLGNHHYYYSFFHNLCHSL